MNQKNVLLRLKSNILKIHTEKEIREKTDHICRQMMNLMLNLYNRNIFVDGLEIVFENTDHYTNYCLTDRGIASQHIRFDRFRELYKKKLIDLDLLKQLCEDQNIEMSFNQLEGECYPTVFFKYDLQEFNQEHHSERFCANIRRMSC